MARVPCGGLKSMTHENLPAGSGVQDRPQGVGTRWTTPSFLEGFAVGSDAAWARFVNQCVPPLYKRVRCHLPKEEAEDLIQEVILKVLGDISEFVKKYDPMRSGFRAWLTTITTHAMRDRFRYLKLRQVTTLDKEALENSLACMMDDQCANLIAEETVELLRGFFARGARSGCGPSWRTGRCTA